MHPYIGPALETDHFRHVEFKLPEFSKMATGGPGHGTPEFRAARDAYHDPRWNYVSKFAKQTPAVPQDVQDEAAKHSRDLVFSFTSFRSKIIRGQSHGSLDSSRLARLASPGLAPREFDRLAMTAYRRREHAPAKSQNPRIAIVADANNYIRSRNLNYMKMLGKLAYVVGEAAKISGVETALYASRGFRVSADPLANLMAETLGMKDTKKKPHVVITVKDWDDEISGTDYSVFTDTVPGTRIVLPLTLFQGVHILTGVAGGMNSQCGAGGIEFARSQGANLVIAFGTFDASEKADMTFSPNQSVDEVVRGIVAALGNSEAA